MCTYPKARSREDLPGQEPRLQFSDWEYEDYGSVGKEDKGVGQNGGDYNWDNRRRTTELYGTTRPVGRTRGPFRRGPIWYSDQERTRGCVNEGRQAVDQKRVSRNNLFPEHGTAGGGLPDERGYHTDSENAATVVYRKPHDCDKDVDFRTSRIKDNWGMNHWRENGNCGDLYPGGHSLDYESKGGRCVDQSRTDRKYCETSEERYTLHGSSSRAPCSGGTSERCTVDDRNFSVAQEDPRPWSVGCDSSIWGLKPGCEMARLQDRTDDDSGGIGAVAVQPRAMALLGGCPRTRAGRSDWNLDGEDRASWADGTEAWQRNSCYRRTAPGAFRHHIKEKQGR
ncbi:uncharacterized protein LOC123026541 [Varanus komodoensis]|uniref:uncharacterized protein LOC123026541 n=1 Tax=Varanus komodoensis TaxID=61221 RepID=UPI001CF79460|nr:uncharacterized protein LOC123026541 [Varanus komodoensis]